MTRIRQLKDLVEDVRFNTVHVFNPTQPVSTVCDLTPGRRHRRLPAAHRQSGLRSAWSRWPQLGGGDFRDFRNHEPINFLNFNFGQVRRAYVLKELGRHQRMRAGGLAGWTRRTRTADGLTDAEERRGGHEPAERGHGRGRLLGRRGGALPRSRGADFNPTRQVLPDGGGWTRAARPRCAAWTADCDGLLDCDEQIIGTNSKLADSDRDGVPDALEWQLGTQGCQRRPGRGPGSRRARQPRGAAAAHTTRRCGHHRS